MMRSMTLADHVSQRRRTYTYHETIGSLLGCCCGNRYYWEDALLNSFTTTEKTPLQLFVSHASFRPQGPDDYRVRPEISTRSKRAVLEIQVARHQRKRLRDADPMDSHDDEDDHLSVTPLGAAELLFMSSFTFPAGRGPPLVSRLQRTAVGSFVSALMLPMPTLSGSQDFRRFLADCEEAMGSPAFFQHDILTHCTSDSVEQDENFQDSNRTTTRTTP